MKMADEREIKNPDDYFDDLENMNFEEVDLTAEPEVASPEAELQVEINALKDKLMRSMAEAENIRKRGQRERRDAETYGASKLARELLPVADNLARALGAVTVEQREVSKALIEGIELTQRELLGALAKSKITPITPTVGDKFDPNIHQAMFEAPVPNSKAGHIIQVMNDGYMIADRLLRPAQVGVSSGG